MPKRVVIAHGWADDPTRGWMAWLREQLSTAGIQVAAPQFPNPKTPEIPAWMRVYNEAVGRPDEGLVLVGHSLGCLVVLRYLSDLETDIRIAGIVLVAGMAEIPSWKAPGLFDPPLDFERAKAIARRRICLYSDDDDKVLPKRTKHLAELIDAELVLDAGRGHFAGLHGCDELPSALEAIDRCFETSDSP